MFVNAHHARAVREGRRHELVDVLIVGRGGGSTEDLWAFNEEEVARAIRASAIPIISAVGHETDVTIADFVADKRAATPSAAAELVAAQEDLICNTLDRLGQQLTRLTRFKVSVARNRVQEQALSQAFDEVRGQLRTAHRKTESATNHLQLIVSRTLTGARTRVDWTTQRLSPSRLETRLTTAQARFISAASSLRNTAELQLGAAQRKLALAAASLDALSPLAVLQRGYAIAENVEGRLLREASAVKVGDEVKVRLAKGRLITRVDDIEG
jgi:exodeoxyribonuclease VII large subunit